MKRIWNKIVSKTYKDNRGLSLVEVLCAVAILALVTGVIGSVIVISTRTYRRGISETNIQQEAQLAANNIGNIVKDACSVIYGESGAQYIKNGSELMNKEDGTAKMQAAGFTELSIITNEKIQYTMTYDEGNKKLLYQEYNTTDGTARTNPEIMATNIVDFKADTSDFEESKTIKLTMKVEDSDTNRSIPMEYTMTSRNGDGEGGEYVTNTDSVVIIFLEDDVVLVPGETYEIPISVTGKLTEGALEWVDAPGLTPGALTLDYAQITVPSDSAGAPTYFTIRTKDKDGDGNPKDTKSCDVYIRKVDSVAVSHSIDTSNSRGGMLETAGTVYTFNANVDGNELAKRVAYAYDSNYKTAQAVVWSWELAVDGVVCRREFTCTPNADGRYEFAFTDDNPAKFEEYISITTNKEDAIIPQLIMKVEKDMPSDFSLKVRATSKHALGVNKADSAYGDKDNPAYYGEDLVEPRETILHENLEIVLEPQQTGRVALGMKGGLSSNVTFEYHGVSDLYDSTNNPDGTETVYDAATDEAVITLGRDEMGSGANVANPYIFTIDVLVNGVKKSTITVHVCRIDTISIEVKDEFTKNNNVLKTPTYDFRSRINVTNGSESDSKAIVKDCLIQYKSDGTVDADAVANTLASRITWVLINHKTGKTVHEDTVICKAGVGAGNTGEIIGKYNKEYKNEYTVVNVKPARIEQDADGKWFLKQFPEIDISPKANEDSGLAPDTELKVTIEMLHPQGVVQYNGSDVVHNKSGHQYNDVKVEASASVKGNQTIETDEKIIVVEPGQGTDDPAQSDKELVIPLQANAGIYRMEVTISGAKNTKLSYYPDYAPNGKKMIPDANGNRNPYLFSTGVGSGTRTWLLGLKVGENETGRDDTGLIDVTVNGFNGDNKKIVTTTFQLAVRRVNKVSVKVEGGKKIADVNKAGSEVTLGAYPTGENGTKYFGVQKYTNGGEPVFDIEADSKSSNVCRWEQEGHGEYRSPLTMKWTMVIDGQEKPLEQWTEYIDAGKVDEKIVKKDYKDTVTFKLLKPLPNGAEIRATSLHSIGTSGDVQYNKSAKEYGKKYGTLKISSRIDLAKDCGFERYNEQNFIVPGFESIPDYRSITNWSEQQTFYRYRPVGGTWSQYYRMDSGEYYKAYITGGRTGAIFRSDTDYELDCVFVVYNTNEKKIYWPLNDGTLLQPGMGFAEAGYSLAQWDYENKLTDQQKNFQCRQEYYIAKTDLFIEPYPDKDRGQTETRQTISERAQSAGTEKDPVKVDSWSQGNSKQWFSVNMDPYAFCLHAQQGIFGVFIDKKTDNGWESVVENTMQDTQNWTVTARNPEITVGYAYGAKGLYRIRSYIDGIKWTKPSGDMFSPVYEEGPAERMQLYDDDGNGTIFVEFEIQTPPPSWGQ